MFCFWHCYIDKVNVAQKSLLSLTCSCASRVGDLYIGCHATNSTLPEFHVSFQCYGRNYKAEKFILYALNL